MSGICEYYSKMSIIFLSLSTSVLICRYVSSFSFSTDYETLSSRICCYLVESMFLTSAQYFSRSSTQPQRTIECLMVCKVFFSSNISLFSSSPNASCVAVAKQLGFCSFSPSSSVLFLPLSVFPPSAPVPRLKVEAFCLHFKRKTEMLQLSFKVESHFQSLIKHIEAT